MHLTYDIIDFLWFEKDLVKVRELMFKFFSSLITKRSQLSFDQATLITVFENISQKSHLTFRLAFRLDSFVFGVPCTRRVTCLWLCLQGLSRDG